ncbi:hypothetical protein AB7M16_002040 [Bradyrhizobium sp. USDA 372]
MESDAAGSRRQISDRTHDAGFSDLMATVGRLAVRVGNGGECAKDGQRERKSGELSHRVARSPVNGGLWREAEPPSNLTGCLSGGQCCFAHLCFDLREPCLGGCYGGFCFWHKREGVRMRPLRHSQLHLSRR